MRNKNKTPPLESLDEWVQPLKCQGCIWGRLEGTKQFCGLPRCVLDLDAMERR
ncbi:hypothetical protein [Paenibacillus sanguinis]|uniref:hypothetical protein n=1 Tax=Paenibacillus sanguinis TaxID=225906 RepID=UPI00037AB4EC|nr:hypothetical protein [Paenibacillus sanguinis]